MTPKEAAAALDGSQYLHEGSPELFKAMKASGLVAVFGYSDDDGGQYRICASWAAYNAHRGRPAP